MIYWMGGRDELAYEAWELMTDGGIDIVHEDLWFCKPLIRFKWDKSGYLYQFHRIDIKASCVTR